jgi:hypothetical protein
MILPGPFPSTLARWSSVSAIGRGLAHGDVSEARRDKLVARTGELRMSERSIKVGSSSNVYDTETPDDVADTITAQRQRQAAERTDEEDE